MTLPLYGVASQSVGFDANALRSVIRLRSACDVAERGPSDFALVRTPEELRQSIEAGWQSIFAISGISNCVHHPACCLIEVVPEYAYLAVGDVVGFDHASRKFRVLYRRNSLHNSFLVTDRCNNYCLMCSQPPKKVDDQWRMREIKESLALIDPSTAALTFTGGETLTDWEEMIELLRECRDRLPGTAIQVLTNGRAFSASAIVNAWKAIEHPHLMAAIPVYASVDHVHDYIVQAKGAFDETIRGILKLKDRGQRVEIRIVLHALTAPIIEETCRWLARNLPFVDHVALMGLENTGFAIANDAMLWIDPVEFGDALAGAVDHLSAAGVSVSVYNLPKCVLPNAIWPYAVQSISDWKNGFVEECDRCEEKSNCSGFFTTGRPRVSRGVRAIRHMRS